MALSEGTTACRSTAVKYILLLPLLWQMACKAPEPKAGKLPFYNTADFDAVWIPENDRRYPHIHRIGAFSLQDQEGNTITGKSMEGHVYVANFFFTTCASICPKMTANLKTLQDTFASDEAVKLLSFSVTPWIDSVGRLATYGRLHGINPVQWHLLTGSRSAIYNLARRSFFAEKGLGLQKDTSEFLHTESLLLIDRHERIRGIYNATQRADMERVIEDVRLLLQEE